MLNISKGAEAVPTWRPPLDHDTPRSLQWQPFLHRFNPKPVQKSDRGRDGDGGSTHPSASHSGRREWQPKKKLPTSNWSFATAKKNGSAANNRKKNQMPPETFEFQETVPSTPQHPPSKMEMKLPETRQVVKLTLNQTRKPLGSFPTIDSKNHPTAGRRFFPSPFRWGHQRTSSENTIDYSGRGGKKEDTMINP